MAEAGKAKILPIPGNTDTNLDVNNKFVHSAMVDDGFQLVAVHVDEGVKQKILKEEYIDFALLLPKDRISTAEDGRMELVNKDR